MLNSHKFGVPDQVCTLHAKTLNNTKYYIMTALGTSTTLYSSTKARKICGQRQGAGSLVTSWTLISIPLMATLEKSSKGCKTISPNRKNKWTKNIVHFVDDKRLYANNWKVNKQALIKKQLEHTANNWNELITTTRGEPELT